MSSPDRAGVVQLHQGRAVRGTSRGLAMVEFAITVPLLLFVFIAVAELGRAFYQYTALTKGVRDGARFLATLGSGSSGIGTVTPEEQELVQRLVVRGTVAAGAPPILPGFQENQVVLEIPATGVTPPAGAPASSAASTDYIRVTATYTFQPLFAGIPTFGFGTGAIATPVNFSATAVQRSLRS